MSVHPYVIKCPPITLLVIKCILLVYIKSHIRFINNPARIKRLRSRLALEKSLEAVKKIEDDEAANDKLEEEGDIAKLPPKAVQAYLLKLLHFILQNNQ